MRTVVVVPCYNEARRLDVRRFLDFADADPLTDFVFVNDGSSDCTLEILEGMHHARPQRFSFVHLKNNRGKAEAVRRGMLLALELPADCVGFWDADLATPLEEIGVFRRVLQTRQDIELVVGTRLALLGRRIERHPLRHRLGRLFARAAATVLGLAIYDTQCGAKLFRATPMLASALGDPLVSRWIVDVELLARLKMLRPEGLPPLGQVIYECPLESWREVAGSKLRPADFFRSLEELAQIYWKYLLPGRRQPASIPVSILRADTSLDFQKAYRDREDRKAA